MERPRALLGRGLLLLALMAGGAQALDSYTMMEARIAVPAPVLPLLPMTIRQQIALSAGGRNDWSATRTERLTDSSLTPLSMAPALLAHGAQLQFRKRVLYWGGEGSVALHGSAYFSGMGIGTGGLNFADSGWSLLVWGGVGLMGWQCHYTTLERSVTVPVVDNHGDNSAPVPAPAVVERRTLHRDSSGRGAVLAAGLSVSLLDDQAISPYAAGRLLVGPLRETHDSVEIRNPVDFSRVTFDAGIRWRFARRWRFRLGLGAVSYLGPKFHGLDLSAQVGFQLDAKIAPQWWITGNKPVEPPEEDAVPDQGRMRSEPKTDLPTSSESP